MLEGNQNFCNLFSFSWVLKNKNEFFKCKEWRLFPNFYAFSPTIPIYFSFLDQELALDTAQLSCKKSLDITRCSYLKFIFAIFCSVIESQTTYVMDCLKKLIRSGYKSMDLKQESAEKYLVSFDSKNWSSGQLKGLLFLVGNDKENDEK